MILPGINKKSVLLYFRIHELQLEVTELQEKLEISEREMKNYSKQVCLQVLLYYYLAVVAIAMALVIICILTSLGKHCRACETQFF